ncbi:MAG: putative aspartyl aminopeptidase [Parachlamydiales bacterium]|nr:putative aspartyl aminopeptidase [Parachlamydiales bacterium]
MNTLLTDFIRFLDRSPTVWHAAREVGNRLAQADFTPLFEEDRWVLERGKGYFVVRDDAAVCAFRIPKEPVKRTQILASHLDSPGLKLKPHADLHPSRLSQFATEVYGSPLLHTWLDRDLALAGRVIVRTANGETESRLVFLDDYPMIIPSLAPHLDRSIAEKGLILNKQDHLNPICSIAHSKNHPATVQALLGKHIAEPIVAFDLFLVPLQKASFVGAQSEMIASARLDNLTSAYASLYAIIEAQPSAQTLPLAIFWDHEEIGSKSYLGAESFFVNQVLERICTHEKIDREDYYRLKSRSYCVSSDLAHGFNPNYADRYDPQNSAHLGDGVVLKTSAMQRYATSGSTAAPLIRLCQEKKLPLQKFTFRSDIPSGSTVGSIMAAVAGFPSVDIGIAGWAMHSIRETIATHDQTALCELLKLVLETGISFHGEST